jgi:3-hydroxyacyl-CoA dehydrogenase
MKQPVSSSVRDGVGVICVDNPPVNALNVTVRQGIKEAVESLAPDPAVNAIVLLCAGRTFIAGADITEFGKPRQPPALSEVCDTLEASAKPVVAALHGTALGGGFEIALACHYRVAVKNTSMGLPEVKLGLIPGAGGANRLTRIIGPVEALKLVASGDSLSAAKALNLGLLDRIVEGDLEQAALAFARSVGPAMPIRHRSPPEHETSAFEAAAASLTRKSAGQLAPAACVASVQRALTMPFDEAIAADREEFAALSAGTQSRALRHAFFAERQAAKLDGKAGVEPKPINSVAILGAGTMGGGIAMSFAAAGIPATLIDAGEEALERGLARIRSNYATSVKRGSIDEATVGKRLELIAGSTDRTAAAEAGLVIEAVFEDMDLKKQIFADLDRLCGPETVLASNTSALDVDEMTTVMKRPDRFVGLHFFSPANVMKLVEVVQAQSSSDRTLATSMAIAKRIGKVPVLSGNCDGFIGNRMVAKRSAQVDRLLLEGALPHEVDEALKSFGFPMGPLAINDMSGLDVGYSIRKRRGTKFPVADAVVESGRLGQKTGRGYYRYEEGSRVPLRDPEVEQLIVGLSEQLGIPRRTIGQEEMIERMLFPLINEGARILEEGIAQRASDIDVVWINGYGFPRWRGGPMFHADEVGLSYIAERLAHFGETIDDSSLEPASLLRDLANRGSSFRELQAERLQQPA